MFSSMTMALSTSMPTANASPPSASTLSDRPNSSIARNAPTVLVMMCRKMMTVDRPLRRNSSSVTNVNTAPVIRFSVTRSMDE